MPKTSSKFLTDGCLNFRDLGGCRTKAGQLIRPGRLFRSDSLHRLLESDIENTINSRGIKRAFDLRSDIERLTCPIPEYASMVKVQPMPIIDQTMQAPFARSEVHSISDGYKLVLEESGTQLIETVRALNSEESPAIIFCTAGKDRTGILSALILGILGVSDEQIVEDYALTKKVIVQIRRKIAEETPERIERWADLPVDVLSADRDNMVGLIDFVNSHWGGFRELAIENGLENVEIESLVKWLIG
ncbi:MAG: tyrosine-protein phosphatase [Acidimicrobiales bacterium]|nr:tyrosine-protein phosphatase [Acidimicrobiales bacterium]|tara:strand:- start:178 stop:915 length:738 start_codon:yes stop_codon:yes gene_type:complete